MHPDLVGAPGLQVHLEQAGEGQHCRVEFDPYHLGVPGLARADLFVGRMSERPPRIARNDRMNPLQTLENGLQAPKTAAAHNRHRTRL